MLDARTHACTHAHSLVRNRTRCHCFSESVSSSPSTHPIPRRTPAHAFVFYVLRRLSFAYSSMLPLCEHYCLATRSTMELFGPAPRGRRWLARLRSAASARRLGTYPRPAASLHHASPQAAAPPRAASLSRRSPALQSPHRCNLHSYPLSCNFHTDGLHPGSASRRAPYRRPGRRGPQARAGLALRGPRLTPRPAMLRDPRLRTASAGPPLRPGSPGSVPAPRGHGASWGREEDVVLRLSSCLPHCCATCLSIIYYHVPGAKQRIS
jgi:hypothetical protein